jgi:hypothetical protein
MVESVDSNSLEFLEKKYFGVKQSMPRKKDRETTSSAKIKNNDAHEENKIKEINAMSVGNLEKSLEQNT